MDSTFDYEKVVELVRSALVEAGSAFREGRKHAYERATKHEKSGKTRWVLETVLGNAEVAERNHSPLCDDADIPCLMLEVGPGVFVTGRMLDVIRNGIASGLRELPGHPMGTMGDDNRRIDQSDSLDPGPAGAGPTPILLRICGDNAVRLRIMMFGSGPTIKAKTRRISHKHNTQVIIGEIMKWTIERVAQLGYSSYTFAAGIGRSHFEAASMMLQTQAGGCHDVQSGMGAEVTRRINELGIGPLGSHGRISVIAAFVKVGSQKASGVRIVCVKSACCFESRIATVDLTQ